MHGSATYAERLGWPAGSRVVLFHTDDAGLCRSANQGAIEALEKGVARSLSVMAPCAGVREMAAYLRAHPEADAGVHLTLTSEFRQFRWKPVCPKEEVPGLVDTTGHFHADTRTVMALATADEVDREIRAQVRVVAELGVSITHLDSHMGVLFTRRDFFDRYARLGIETGIPVLAEAPLRSIGEKAGNLARRVAGRLHLRNCYDFPRQDSATLARLWDAGLLVVDRLHADSYGWPHARKSRRLFGLLRHLSPGITVVLLHCALPESDAGLLGETAETRFADTAVVTAPEVRELLNREGILLTTWRDLMLRRALSSVKA